jgi:phosphate transport system protein
MTTGTKHTLTAFDEDMDYIRSLIAEMGARAEAAVTNAMQALLNNDLELAESTRIGDKIIDQLETEIEKRVVQTTQRTSPSGSESSKAARF